MKTNLKKEVPLIAVVLMPFVYLAYIWKDLPNQVPVHWNIKGEIDRYGDKVELLLILFLLPVLIYLLFSIIPIIDPKKNMNKMGKKYQSIKVLLTVFMSVLAMYILYTVQSQSLSSPNGVVILLGTLFIILGNYFKTIKANYFIGIRTPWTLEDETIWKETHLLAGKLWFAGGLLIVFASMILNSETNIIIFGSVTAIITIIPIVHSYLLYRKKNTKSTAS